MRGDILHHQRPDTRGRQFDRQRDAIKAVADLRDCRGVVIAHGERRERKRGPFHEQAARLVTRDVRGHDAPAGVGRLQRGHPPGQLPRDAQRLAAGGKDAGVVIAAQHSIGETRADLDQMLTVVQEQQQWFVMQPQRVDQRREDGTTRLLMHTQGSRDGLRHQRRVRQRGKFDQPDALRVGVHDFGGELQRQARLARATRARQGQ